MSDYYDVGGAPADGSHGDSVVIRNEFKAVQDGITKKLPPLSGNPLKIVRVNAGATKMETVAVTGTGDVVMSTSPTLVTPNLGTPSAINLTNATNFPAVIYQRSNILGTVSQSSGVPTGAIIEVGSNANGSYTKWADGTMICRASISLGSVAITTANGSMFVSGSAPGAARAFPTNFIAPPICQYTAEGASQNVFVSVVAAPTSSATGGVYFWTPTSGTQNISLVFYAIGRWF